jgi:exodeoxyribonuclease VII large subunit
MLADRAIARMGGVLPELSASRAKVQRASASLVAGYRRLYALRSARLASLEAQCRALSPEQTLSRGYAIVRTQQGSVVRSSREVQQAELLEVRFAAGAAEVKVLALKHRQDGP